MPYVDLETRRELLKRPPITPGELNFIITLICKRYLYGRTGQKQPGYMDFNAVIGVLECAKQEMYRRVVAPYEDVKAEENGDVWG